MAQPSSERERDRDRERHRSSHHHHHRTISSTTLLLALSLILAVLAISLTIPSFSGSSASATDSNGILGAFTPKRAQGLLARESAVAAREAEVARREAELGGVAGSVGGVMAPLEPSIPGCPPATLSILTHTVTVAAYPTAVVREVQIEGIEPAPPKDTRVDNLLDREVRVSERERDVGGREETVGKRENDAARREQWIMEQLMKLGNDKIVEEEVIVDAPRRKKDVPPVNYDDYRSYDQPHPPRFNEKPDYPNQPPQFFAKPDRANVPPQFQRQAQQAQHDNYYERAEPDHFHEEQQQPDQNYRSSQTHSRDFQEDHPVEPVQPNFENQPANPNYPNPNAPNQPIAILTPVDDPSSTRIADPPAPIKMHEEKKPKIGKTTEWTAYAEPTPKPTAYAYQDQQQQMPEPTPQFIPHRQPHFDHSEQQYGRQYQEYEAVPDSGRRQYQEYEDSGRRQYQEYEAESGRRQYQDYEAEGGHRQYQDYEADPQSGREYEPEEEEERPVTIRRTVQPGLKPPSKWLWT